MTGDIGWLGAWASFSLVLIAIGISLSKRLEVERSLLWSSFRAAAQLMAVGVLFGLIFGSANAMTWAWVWVIGMTLVSAEVIGRRARQIPGLWFYSLAALGSAVGVTLGILFGFGVFDLEPVTFVVLAGITLGNTLPGAVQAADTISREFIDEPQRIEALLSLGFDRAGATRMSSASAVRQALVPQIERTKVIGLIALPGTMTGMLLAGAEPLPAVLIQLVITYLVLGSVSVAVSVIVSVIATRAFTNDLRLADWVTRAR
jgi:putative ABC transport system permease protein